MSTVPPTDSFNFSENSAQNQAALEELTSAIVFGQGADTITLLLVRCNYGRLRDQMVEQLKQTLAKENLQGPVQVLQLEAEDHNLYARLQAYNEQLPGTVLVLGAERLDSSELEAFLVDLNKRREEFRREFRFPLVLWFTDEGYRRLSQYANDFESIAGGETIEFALSTEALIQGLQLACDRLFNTLLAPNTPESFNQRLKQLDTDYLATDEVSLALADLQQRGVQLTPDLQAGVTFAQGLNVPNQDAIELFGQSTDYWQTRDPLKYGLALFYLGRARYYAVDSIKYQNADWESVLPPLQDAVDVFEQAERPDLVCKSINQLERVLHRLQRWEQLETVAQKAVNLRQRYPNPNTQAENYGFLADVAMQRDQWQQGAELSQLALDTLERQDSWWRMLYLARLAEANYQLGKREAAVVNLQSAQQMGVMEHPTLYSNILTQLQQRLREQGHYLEAFKVKQERLAVEKQYGLRAFIGAGRLRSQRIEQLGTAQSERASLEEIAPEIASSGRYGDLQELLKRIAGTTHKLVVVHGTSGVGKSSLINGGLLPALRGRALENRRNMPVMVRKYTDWRQALGKALAAALKEMPGAVRRRGESLLREVLGEEASVGAPQTPNPGGFDVDSLGLDQEILDVLRICEENTLRPVLLFDQFEEFFFANPDPLQRREFFRFVAECLELPGALKIVFSIREDYLHYLLEARQLVKQAQLGSMARAQLEDILGKQILYEIGNFSPADAKAIIENLASGARMYLEPELVDTLVTDLAGPLQEVRPIEMQVVGAQLQTDGIQTLAEYRQLPGQPKETLVRRYLDDVVVDCGEENRQLAELVLFLLTDERGTRPLKTRPELVRELEALGVVPETGELDLVLRILTGSGIVVYLPDTPDDRYQLVHDYLAGVIRAQQAPQLEQLVAELEEEKRQRRRSEARRKKLARNNQSLGKKLATVKLEQRELQKRNQQARRSLLLITITGAVVASATVFFVSNQVQLVRRITSLEREGTAAAERFDFQETESLFTAFKAAKEVNRIIKTHGRKYLAASPLLTLQTSLTSIRETRLPGYHYNIVFSPDGRNIVTSGSDTIVRLWDLNGNQLSVMTGHQNAVQKMVFSPNGRYIATSDYDGVARLWDLSGKELTVMRSHEENISEIKFSPNSRLIITGGSNGTLRLWDLSGKELTAMRGHKENISEITFSSTWKQIITRDSNGVAQLWNLSGDVISTMRSSQEKIEQIVFSPDGRHIATRDSDGVARLWNLKGENIAATEASHKGEVLEMVFSPDSRHIATSDSDGTVRLWNLEGKELVVIEGHEEAVYEIAFSPDSNYIATGDYTTLRLWNLEGKELAMMPGHEDISQIIFSPDGNHIATETEVGTARLWNLNGRELAAMKGHGGSVSEVMFGPNGRHIATSGSDGTARLWRLDGKELAVMQDNQNRISKIVFSPSGRYIATIEFDKVRLWNLEGKELAVMQANQERIFNIMFSPNGRHIATSVSDDTVRLWNLSGKELAVMQGNQPIFSPDSRYIATSSSDGIARLWNLFGEELAVMQGNQGRHTTKVIFSPDGRYIATSGLNQPAKLWNLNGEELTVIESHQDSIYHLVFAPNSRYIATSGIDEVRLWSLNGKELATLQGNQPTFSPDGRYIVTSDSDGTIRLWNPNGKQLTIMEGHQGTISQVVFSPAGYLVTSGVDKTTRLWDIEGNQIAQYEGTGAISTDWQYIAVKLQPDRLRENGLLKLWPLYTLDRLDELLASACEHLIPYLTNNPERSDEDRALCNISSL